MNIRMQKSDWFVGALVFIAGLCAFPNVGLAANPVVKTVPWVSGSPLIPHDTYAGKQITLKGTTDVQNAPWGWTWDFGDGTATASGTVGNRYVIEATHVYGGAVGTVYTARLTVRNSATGESSSKEYYVKVENNELQVQANIAIDEGLWYLHKTQTRTTSGGQDVGYWNSGNAASGYYGLWAVNVNAFEVNGHKESGSPDNPYTETVGRGLRYLISLLYSGGIGSQANVIGTFNPDTDGNGKGVFVNQSLQFYQGGMFMDAIIASGTPDAVATMGPVGIIGRTYKAIVQDMADAYNWAQYDYAGGGGWRYNANEFPDNSACQWAAIGLIPAQRNWGIPVPQIVKDWNKKWLEYSQNADGYFGYTDPYPVWGTMATTASGMVQLALDGYGRGNSQWDNAESYMYDHFGVGGGYGNDIQQYYYGLFSFVKSMLLHDSNGDNISEPIQFLKSSNSAKPLIDWYADPAKGVAHRLVSDQSGAGYWWGHNATGEQYPFETAQAIIMLQRTLFEAGAPVAVAKVTPNPGVVGQSIVMSGADSFHQDSSKSIVAWDWDFDNDGNFDAAGPVATCVFNALGDYPVKLRVTDNATPQKSADTVVIVHITVPPIGPTADAGGPYVFSPFMPKWFLDGTGSVNPDEGQSEPTKPGDTIVEYAWDLDGSGNFNNAYGPTPDVTTFFKLKGQGSYLIQLRVTDRTKVSFPSSGMENLFDTASTTVTVRTDDPNGIKNLTARAKSGKVSLVWTDTGAHHYNAYRSTVSGGPYAYLGTCDSTYSTYYDNNVVNNTTYYYIVRPAALNGYEIGGSNEASATPRLR